MKQLSLFLFILFLIIGCGRSSFNDEVSRDFEGEEAFMAAAPEASMVEPDPEAVLPDRKIIRESWVRMEVKDIKESSEKVKALVMDQGGYLTNESDRSTDYSLETSMSIRVPADHFDTLLDGIIAVAEKTDYKNVTARDVTEEFVDIEARLRTKKEVEKRYLEILSKAATIKDILLVEEQLRVIREEIEAREGRLKYLQNQVSYSTINLEMYQKLTFEPGFKFFSKIWKALKGGWKGLLNVLVGLVYIWPLLIIGVGVFIWIRRRISRKKESKD